MEFLKKTFRWFGPNFGVTLNEIKQIGAEEIVTACHQIPIGEIWPESTIKGIKEEIIKAGLDWTVVESVNVHNSIKYAEPDRDFYIENYIKTLKNLANQGLKTVCYNFMPIIDWTRTDLSYVLPNGAITLRFDPIATTAFDLFILKRKSDYSAEEYDKAKTYFEGLTNIKKKELENTILSGLPGSKEAIDINFFKKYLAKVSEFSKQDLQANLIYFLKAIIPEAEKYGINMAIHPDDPPFSVFGIPRITSTLKDLNFLYSSVKSLHNGLTFCSGSLGAAKKNEMLEIIIDHGNRIHFLHLRSIQKENDGSFYEAKHLEGSFPLSKIMDAIISEQEIRLKTNRKDIAIPFRPDHGHLVLNDVQKAKEFYPGYSLIGRAIALAEVSGLEKGMRFKKNILL